MNADSDWTRSSAKWVAVLVLGVASVLGVSWAILSGRAGPIPATGQQPETQSKPATDSETIGEGRSRPDVARLININTASSAELQLLPGIGPARASAIIEDRTANGPFHAIDDLQRVHGIGPKTVQNIRPLVTIK